jgi:hypothetical protein
MSFECELLDRRSFKTQTEARMAIFKFIEGFYNPRRRHSSIGYLSPIAFERQYAATAPEPGAHERAVVLVPVKERPGSVTMSCTANAPAVLDSRSTRLPRCRAGRDEKMLSAEPKDRPERRTECSQTRYSNPKTSRLHETGTSPVPGKRIQHLSRIGRVSLPKYNFLELGKTVTFRRVF